MGQWQYTLTITHTKKEFHFPECFSISARMDYTFFSVIDKHESKNYAYCVHEESFLYCCRGQKVNHF